MAITIVGVGTVAGGQAAAITPPLDIAGLQDGDLLIGIGESAGVETYPSAATNGFAHVTGSPNTQDTQTTLTVIWNRYSAGLTAHSWGDSGNHNMGRYIAFRGVKATGDPWNVTPVAGVESTSNNTAEWPSVTTTAADCLIVLCIATGRDIGSTANLGAVTNAALTSITEQMDNWTASGTGGGFGLVTGFKATAGAVGQSTATMGSNDTKALITLALEPAPAGVAANAGLATATATATDAVGTDLPVTAGLAGRYDATKITGLANGAAVSQWDDTSGNGRHATQATGTSQPTYQTAVQNGLPVVRFDGADDFLRTAAFGPISQPTTVFLACRLRSNPAGAKILWDTAISGNRQLVAANGTTQWEIYAGGSAVAGGVPDTNWHILTATYNGASSSLRVDGAQVLSGNPGAGGLEGITLAADVIGDGDSPLDLGEWVGYGALVAGADRDTLEAYLTSKWVGAITNAPAGAATGIGVAADATAGVAALAEAAAASGVATSSEFGPPTGLQAVAVSASQINVSWDAVPWAISYDIERDGAVIVTDHAATSYADTGLASSTQYSYRVRAVR